MYVNIRNTSGATISIPRDLYVTMGSPERVEVIVEGDTLLVSEAQYGHKVGDYDKPHVIVKLPARFKTPGPKCYTTIRVEATWDGSVLTIPMGDVNFDLVEVERPATRVAFGMSDKTLLEHIKEEGDVSAERVRILLRVGEPKVRRKLANLLKAGKIETCKGRYVNSVNYRIPIVQADSSELIELREWKASAIARFPELDINPRILEVRRKLVEIFPEKSLLINSGGMDELFAS